MDMNNLFEKFKVYVDAMDDNKVRESIHNAEEHTVEFIQQYEQQFVKLKP